MSVYDERPWLALYGPGVPHEIELEHESMLAAFGHTAARHPDKPAIVYFDTAISFRELDSLSDALAAGLAEHGFKPGDRLGIYLQNVPQFVIAMLATWKAGGVMVSISPMLKHKELSAQLAGLGRKRTGHVRIAVGRGGTRRRGRHRRPDRDHDIRAGLPRFERAAAARELAATTAIADTLDLVGADRRPPRCRKPPAP